MRGVQCHHERLAPCDGTQTQGWGTGSGPYLTVLSPWWRHMASSSNVSASLSRAEYSSLKFVRGWT